MTWLLVKHSIQKAWIWARNNWKFLALLLYTILLYLLFSKNAKNALETLMVAREQHKAELEAVNEVHSEEKKKREENLKKYQETVKIIEEKYKEESEKLTTAKKKRVKEIIDNHGDKPEELAELLKETFGFEITN